MAEYQYDVAVLGGGPGGYVAAIKAAQAGLSVALVEKGFMGGTCLNIGCIPTKALLAAAEVVKSAKGAREFGVTVEGVSFDFAKIMARKERVVKQLRSGVEYLMKKNAIAVHPGSGVLLDTQRIGISGANELEISAQSIILATGSVPSRPPIPGIDGSKVVTSDELLSLTELPRSMVVIGAGAIGLEFAYFFNTLGSKVTVLEGLTQILPQEDAQIAQELTKNLKRQGIAIHTDALVREISDSAGGKTVQYEVRGQEERGMQQAEAELVLVATGRWPYSEGCGFAEQGIAIERRAVQVDEYLHTGVGNIYAIGDVIGGALLAHKASAEAVAAVENITGHHRAMQYHAIPTALYSSPEVASVGLHEAAAIAQGIEVIVGSFPFRPMGKAVAINEREGFVKMVARKEDGVLIGCQAIGAHVTDMIADAVVAVQHGLTLEQFEAVVHPHPTLSEVFHEAVEATLGHAVHM